MTWQTVDDINALEGPAKERAVNDFISDHFPFFRQVGLTVCRRYQALHLSEDAAQEAALVAFGFFMRPIPARLRRLTWSSAVRLMTQDRMKSIVESGGVSGMTGMSTHMRRSRALEKHRRDLSDEGLIVSDEELVDSFNRKVSQTRSNARRQGMVATIHDIEAVRTVPFPEDASVPFAVDIDTALDQGVQACFRAGDEIGLVAALVARKAMEEVPVPVTPEDVAADFGWDAEHSQRILERARRILVENLLD